MPATPAFDAVLFDLDGVLIDSEPVSARAMQTAARRFGFEVPDSAMPSYKGLPGHVVYVRVADEFGSGLVDGPTLRAARDEIYETWLPDIPPMPGAGRLVRDLFAAGRRLALVTSSRRRQAELALETRGLRNVFHAVIGSEDVARSKPDPDPFLEAAKTLGVSPIRCVVIEDSLAGVASGVAAGCHVVAYASSFEPDELLAAGAACVFDTHDDIREYLVGAE